MAAFERLVRFETDGGKVTYGDLPSNVANNSIIGRSVDVLDGDVGSGFKKTSSKATIKKVSTSSTPHPVRPSLTRKSAPQSRSQR